MDRFERIMSKRNIKQLKTVDPVRARFNALNKQMVNITVSKPLLFFVQKMVTDPVFRARVEQLLNH